VWGEDDEKKFCFEMNGDLVGDDKVTKHYQRTLVGWTSSSLTKGSCDSVDWAHQFT